MEGDEHSSAHQGADGGDPYVGAHQGADGGDPYVGEVAFPHLPADGMSSGLPDMLPVSHPDMLPTQPEPEVSGAGPDILSNGIHGERDRPDILAPASEPEISASLYSAPDVSEGRSSSVVHSPTGAFEPVRTSASRHNSEGRGGASRSSSLSETDTTHQHVQHREQALGATANPLWETPHSLASVQLQPAADPPVTAAAPPPTAVPVQVLSSQFFQQADNYSLPSMNSNLFMSHDTAAASETAAVTDTTSTETHSNTSLENSLTANQVSSMAPAPLAQQQTSISTVAAGMASESVYQQQPDMSQMVPNVAPSLMYPQQQSDMSATAPNVAFTPMHLQQTGTSATMTEQQTSMSITGPGMAYQQQNNISSMSHMNPQQQTDGSAMTSAYHQQQQTNMSSAALIPQQQLQNMYTQAPMYHQPPALSPAAPGMASAVHQQQTNMSSAAPNVDPTAMIPQQQPSMSAVAPYVTHTSGYPQQSDISTSAASSMAPVNQQQTSVSAPAPVYPQQAGMTAPAPLMTAVSQPFPSAPPSAHPMMSVPNVTHHTSQPAAQTELTASQQLQTQQLQGFQPQQQGFQPQTHPTSQQQQGFMPAPVSSTQQQSGGNVPQYSAANQMMYQQAPQQYNMYGQPIAPGYNMPPQSMYAPAGYPGPGIPGYPQYPQMRGMAPNPMFYGQPGFGGVPASPGAPQQGQRYPAPQYPQPAAPTAPLDPAMQHRMSMMKGFKPLTQQQLSYHMAATVPQPLYNSYFSQDPQNPTDNARDALCMYSVNSGYPPTSCHKDSEGHLQPRKLEYYSATSDRTKCGMFPEPPTKSLSRRQSTRAGFVLPSLAGHSQQYQTFRPGTPVRAVGPMVGHHAAPYSQMPRNHDGYGRQYNRRASPSPHVGRRSAPIAASPNTTGGSYRDEDYSRPRSRDAYDDRRRAYPDDRHRDRGGYGSRPSSRSGSRPSSRLGSAAAQDTDSEIEFHLSTKSVRPRMYDSAVNPYLINQSGVIGGPFDQSGFSPRPPSRTSSRLDYPHHMTASVPDSDSESSSSESEAGEPTRMSPAKFPLPHVIPRFLSSGHTLEVQACSPDEGQPATFCIMNRKPHTDDSLHRFPGPLVKGRTSKKDVLDYCQKKATACLTDSNLIDRDSSHLLWKLLQLFVKLNGTYIPSDIADLLLENYLHDSYTVSARGGEGTTSEDEHVSAYRDMIFYGNLKEALEYAMAHNLWGHALFLSSKMGSRIHEHVMARFTKTNVTSNDPLQTVYELLSDRQPVIFSHTEDSWGSWRPHLAMLITNTASDPALNKKSIVSLGDHLAIRGLTHASQICYLLAELELEPFLNNKNAKLSIIGMQTGTIESEYCLSINTEMTEVYEFARALKGDKTVISHLQLCKFYWARNLIDQCRPEEALAYMEAISLKVNAAPQKFNYQFMNMLFELAQRIKYYDPDAQYLRPGQPLELEWLTELDTLQQERRKKLMDQPDTKTETSSAANNESGAPPAVQQSISAPGQASEPCTSLSSDQTSQYMEPQVNHQYAQQHNAASTQNNTDYNNQQYQQPQTVQTTQQPSDQMQQGYQYGNMYNPQAVSDHHQSQAPPTQQQQQQQQYGYSTGSAAPPQSTDMPEVPIAAPSNTNTDYFDYKPASMLGKGNTTSSASQPSTYTMPSQAAQSQATYSQQLPSSTAYNYNTQPSSVLASSTNSSYQQAPPSQNQAVPPSQSVAPPTQSYGQSVAPPSQSVAPPTQSYGHNTAPPTTAINRRRLSSTSSKGSAPPSRSLSNSATNRSLAEPSPQAPPSMTRQAPSRKFGDTDSSSSEDEDAGTSIKRSSDPPAKKPTTPAKSGGGGSFLGSIFSKILPKGKNEVKLPDDKKATIIWDDKLKKWIDTEADEVDEVKAAPPPTDMVLGARNSPTINTQPQQMMSTNTAAAPVAPAAAAPPTSGNLYSLKRRQGGKYVDVVGKAAGTSLSPIPQHLFDVTPRSTPTSSIFTPTPPIEADSDSQVNSAPETGAETGVQYQQHPPQGSQEYGYQQPNSQNQGYQQPNSQNQGYTQQPNSQNQGYTQQQTDSQNQGYTQQHADSQNQGYTQQQANNEPHYDYYNNQQQYNNSASSPAAAAHSQHTESVTQNGHHQPPYTQSAYGSQANDMPRNVSMDSLEVQSIMRGPGGTLPPTQHHTQQQHAQHKPANNISEEPPAQSAAPTMPPPLFNPAQFKQSAGRVGGGNLSNLSRYPK